MHLGNDPLAHQSIMHRNMHSRTIGISIEQSLEESVDKSFQYTFGTLIVYLTKLVSHCNFLTTFKKAFSKQTILNATHASKNALKRNITNNEKKQKNRSVCYPRQNQWFSGPTSGRHIISAIATTTNALTWAKWGLTRECLFSRHVSGDLFFSCFLCSFGDFVAFM